MAFLAPTAGLIIASVALPLLLSIYFLKLRRRPVRVSSTLLWEQASSDLEVNAPFRMIRPSRSLFLHLLVLALLCVAVARPTIEGPSKSPDEVIVLLDRSASMSAVDLGDEADTTRLERAKQGALELLDRLGGESRAMVIAYANEPAIVSPMSADLGQARRAIESVTPTDQLGDLGRAMRLVQAVTQEPSEEDGDARSRRILVFSDGAVSMIRADSEPIRLPDGAIEYVPSLPVGTAEGENHAIVACDAARDRDDSTTVRVFCRVVSVNTPERELPLTLRFAGRPVASATVELSASPDREGLLEGSHTFEFDDGGVGGLVVVSHTRSDALEADNAFALTLMPPVGPGVMLVRTGAPSGPVDYVIADALSVPSLGLRLLDEVMIGEYEARVAPAGEDRPREAPVRMSDGSLPDLVIFDRCTPTVMPACPSLSFGGGLPIPGLNLGSPTNAMDQVTFFARTHPLTRYTDLGDLEIRNARRLTLPDAESSRATTRELAAGRDGPLLAEIRYLDTTRVIVAFSLEDSTWWRRPGFPRFLKNALDVLTETGVERSGRSFTTTEPIELVPSGGGTGVRIDGPGGRSIDPGNGGTTVLPRVGVYRVVGGEPSALAVNLASVDESSIAVSSTLDLPTGSIRAGSAANIAPREVWHWFLIVALVLLCLEWFDYAWKSRL